MYTCIRGFVNSPLVFWYFDIKCTSIFIKSIRKKTVVNLRCCSRSINHLIRQITVQYIVPKLRRQSLSIHTPTPYFNTVAVRRAGTIFQQGGQGQKSPVRHNQGIHFLTPISNFRGSVVGLQIQNVLLARFRNPCAF